MTSSQSPNLTTKAKFILQYSRSWSCTQRFLDTVNFTGEVLSAALLSMTWLEAFLYTTPALYVVFFSTVWMYLDLTEYSRFVDVVRRTHLTVAVVAQLYTRCWLFAAKALMATSASDQNRSASCGNWTEQC